MSAFKEMLNNDMSVFINVDEFGETKLIDGEEMSIVVDEDELQRRKLSASNPTDGIYSASLLFYVEKHYFTKRPVPESTMRINKAIYRVVEVQEDDVMYTIVLARNRS